MPRLTIPKPFLVVFTVLLTLSLLALVLASYFYSTTLKAELSEKLPVIIERSLEGNHGYALLILSQVEAHANEQLKESLLHSSGPVINCRAKLKSLAIGQSASPTFNWFAESSSFHNHMDLECRPDVDTALLLFFGMLILLIICAWRYKMVLPTTLCQIQQGLDEHKIELCEQQALLKDILDNWGDADWALYYQLQERQVDIVFAIQIVKRFHGVTLTETQFLWLIFATKNFKDQVARVYDITLSDDRLSLELSTGKIWIRGIELTLSNTPFIYYYWYAKCRIESGDGWVLNPASNKPNLDYGSALHALMLAGPSHRKALTEVECGAKAKTLDQNRSKVRDELMQQLGDVLAKPYLFLNIKDIKTGRFCYRLMLNPEQINLLP